VCVAVCCSALRCVYNCSETPPSPCGKRYDESCDLIMVCCSVSQCVAVCCSVLQCVAVCCSMLQCVALYL